MARKSPSSGSPRRSPHRPRGASQPLYRSAKLWAGAAALLILLGGIWLKNRQPKAEATPSPRTAGVPVPLSDAPAPVRGPRRTEVLDSRLIDVSDDPHKGSPNAPVRVVEFADFQCPSCGQFFLNTYGALNSLYGDQVEWVFVDFPLTQIHDRAMPAALAAACAQRQDKFWPYHDLLFQNQSRLGDGDLKSYAEGAGLDVKKWQACYESGETRAEVEQDVQLGDDLGVTGTPTFFVGGERLTGALPVTSFMEIIDPLLKNAQSGSTGTAAAPRQAGAAGGGAKTAPRQAGTPGGAVPGRGAGGTPRAKGGTPP